MKHVRILRDYSAFKKGQEVNVTENTAHFLLENGIACIVPKSPCNNDCEECDECAGKNKKKSVVISEEISTETTEVKKKATKKKATTK
jgi:hypothetical protein